MKRVYRWVFEVEVYLDEPTLEAHASVDPATEEYEEETSIRKREVRLIEALKKHPKALESILQARAAELLVQETQRAEAEPWLAYIKELELSAEDKFELTLMLADECARDLHGFILDDVIKQNFAPIEVSSYDPETPGIDDLVITTPNPDSMN
jgi:hypothetical protein